MIAFPFVGAFPVAGALLALSGFANAVLNVLIMSVMQLAVPQDMRGKVFSLMGMVTQGLTPVAFALAGVLAVFIPLAPLMAACFAVAVVVGLPFMFLSSFKRFIGFDSGQGHRPEHQLKGRREDCPRQVLRCIISDEKTWRVGRESNESSRQSGGAPPAG